MRDTSAPRGGWRVRRPFGRGIRLHRASRSSRRDGGDAPGRRFPRVRAWAVPSACLPFVPRWAGTSGRGSLFACRVATTSETPSRERCGGLRRPGGPQSNRQFCPLCLSPETLSEGLPLTVVAELSDSARPEARGFLLGCSVNPHVEHRRDVFSGSTCSTSIPRNSALYSTYPYSRSNAHL
jgi:hypothetical protein